MALGPLLLRAIVPVSTTFRDGFAYVLGWQDLRIGAANLTYRDSKSLHFGMANLPRIGDTEKPLKHWGLRFGPGSPLVLKAYKSGEALREDRLSAYIPCDTNVRKSGIDPSSMAKPSQPYRTVDTRPSKDSLVKPGELVDLIEVTPLTLTDRRIYNQLLENAWEAIDKPVLHVIAKSDLRGSHNSNDRVGESIERLMSAIVKIEAVWDGKPAIERVQLLGGNLEMARADGLLEYEIPPRLRKIISNSTIFARLQREVMFALSSKYALTLYEMVQKRGNLRWRSSEKFSLEALRGVLGVPKGKLTSWSNLRMRAIDPAVEEVSALSDYMVEVQPIKTGRSVTHVELRWWRKDGEATGKVERALQFASTGRKAKAEGRTEEVTPVEGKPRPGWLDQQGAALTTQTYETARLRHPGYDIYYVEGEWRSWAAGKEPPADPDRAFLAFFRKFAEANPI